LAFGGEEIGLLGSKYFIEHPTFDLEKIKFYLNFDLAGTGDEGIQVVNGSVFRSQFNRMRELNAADDLLPDVKIRGAACNSDHCVFHEKNIPGFYIYTLGGIRAYHDIYDRAETLPFTEFEDYFELVVKFIEDF
jgi:Zn-dependent M28 family amino/carboxypeptidase